MIYHRPVCSPVQFKPRYSACPPPKTLLAAALHKTMSQNWKYHHASSFVSIYATVLDDVLAVVCNVILSDKDDLEISYC